MTDPHTHAALVYDRRIDRMTVTIPDTEGRATAGHSIPCDGWVHLTSDQCVCEPILSLDDREDRLIPAYWHRDGETYAERLG